MTKGKERYTQSEVNTLVNDALHRGERIGKEKGFYEGKVKTEEEQRKKREDATKKLDDQLAAVESCSVILRALDAKQCEHVLHMLGTLFSVEPEPPRYTDHPAFRFVRPWF